MFPKNNFSRSVCVPKGAGARPALTKIQGFNPIFCHYLLFFK